MRTASPSSPEPTLTRETPKRAPGPRSAGSAAEITAGPGSGQTTWNSPVTLIVPAGIGYVVYYHKLTIDPATHNPLNKPAIIQEVKGGQIVFKTKYVTQ